MQKMEFFLVNIKEGITLEFYPCNKTGEKYTVPSEVSTIGAAFLNNQNIKSLVISAKVTIIYEIGGGSNIETIVLPDSVKFIDEYAFCNCKKLKEIKLGNNIKAIGKEAFKNCESLLKIRIPNSVCSIEKDAFEGCDAKIKTSTYLKRQNDGSYVAKITVNKKDFKAEKITIIKSKNSSITLKKNGTKKLQTAVYVNKKLKGTLSTTAILKFRSSNPKVAKVSSKGVVRGIKKGIATITVKLRTVDLSYKIKVKIK